MPSYYASARSLMNEAWPADTENMENENTRSAAAMMVLLGENLAADVMSHLSEQEVQQISSAMGKIDGKEGQYIDNLGRLLDAQNPPGGTHVAGHQR